jgi:predicted TPR repeat methyltransferase
MRKQGLFAFTVEDVDRLVTNYHGKGYRLTASGRFAYTKQYIHDLLEKHFRSSNMSYSILL